jgi:hypothetical protein
VKSGINSQNIKGIDMNDKNTKDDDVSKEEAGDQKENKNLNNLKKYASIAWAELGFIITDIKNASQKVAEEKAATKEIVAVEGVPNQAKPSATEFFKKQINDIKIFWSYLNKKSKYFLTIITFIIGWNLIGADGGYSQSISSSGKGIELLCAGYSPRHPERKLIEVDCSDREEVIDALRIAWQLVRSQNIEKMGGEDNCWKPYQSAKGTHPNFSLKDVGQTFFGQCNLPLGHVR